jgi:hypothetical protein
MPSRPFEESKAIREGIAEALDNGCDSPREVLEYIEQNSMIRPPSIATIGNIMKEMGYAPLGVKWVKKGNKQKGF